VGAVVVKDGQVIARGFHRKAGAPHAEIDALNKIEGFAEGGTIYITLEPCNHYGRTPPCTEAILKSGIKRVVVGMKDPNPDVEGGGCAFLSRMGLAVETGILEEKCRRLNEAFIKYIELRVPFVIVKSAVTMDGWIATKKGHSKWITNEKSRHFVHRLRNSVDAILVGVGTVIADDPSLTTRLKRGRGKDPIRIILDTHLRTPVESKILALDSEADTIIVTGPEVPELKREKFREMGVKTVICPKKTGKIDLRALMGILGGMSITSLLVEGGSRVVGSLVRRRLVDKFYIFKAPKILGGSDGISMASGEGPDKMDKSVIIEDLEIRRFGDDILVVGYPVYAK
jgi:diaminohydroxyphosphoribosylaminopyrimidine deaminase/5-amino-6-(5-phosphoribosylamino)uracil reductase